MCGIAGFFKRQYHGSFEQCNDQMNVMLDKIVHRGPDDYGKYLFLDSSKDNFNILDKTHIQPSLVSGSCLALGHRRLSILDTSSFGRQPMESNDGNLVLVFNGEIYNYLELKNELDYRWQTKTDTEVILAAYQEWGVDMLKKFDGMFALVILDKRAKKLFGARDVAGIKPLYYALNGDQFLFASEPGSIISALPNNPKFNEIYLSEFLLMGISDHDAGTMIEQISQVKGGYAFTYNLDAGSFDIYPYHNFQHTIQEITPNDFQNQLKAAFQKQLRSDVALGTSLSGGIDSSCIAATIGDMLPKGKQYNALTFTAKNFDEDESKLAQIVAEKAGLNWIAVEPEFFDLKNDIIRMIKNMGEPFSSLSMFAQYQVMQKANSLGIKVMLDGQGGDELYLGYPRMAQRVIAHYLNEGKLRKAYKELVGLKKNLSLPYSTSLLGSIYFNSKSIALKRKLYEVTKYVDRDYINQYRDSVADELFKNKSIYEKQQDEFYKYCLPRLLRFADRNSMAFSVESRVPHLANPLIQIGLSLPLDYKVHNGWTKYIVRKSMQGLVPDKILWSNVKRGFDVPQSYWVSMIKDELLNWVDGLPDNSPINKLNVIKDIHEKPGNTFLWPVLSSIALNQISNIKY